MDDSMTHAPPFVSLRGAAEADDGTGVRFPPGLGLIPPRDFTTLRVKPKATTEWTG